MKFSIITVCFNSAEHIADTLQSVEAQIGVDLEHWVIDGGSRDATLTIVGEHARPWRHVVSEPDRGIYDAMNKGLRLATGEVVGFLNSDDVFADTGVLSRIGKAMQDDRVDACFGDLVYVGEHDLSRVVRYWKSREHRPGLCARGWMPAHPTFYARRTIYERFGDFDLSLTLQSDFEMALRLLDIARIRTRYLPGIMVRMRMGGASNASLRNVVRGNLEAARACRKHGLPGGFRFIVSKVLSRVPQFLARPPRV